MYDIKSANEEGAYALTLEKIRDKIDDYQMFSYYIGHDFKLGEAIKSPLREDNSPSWTVFKSREGNLLYKDFATGKSGGIIEFVTKKFSLNFREALELIDRDFNLNLGGGNISLPKSDGFKSSINMSTVKNLPRVFDLGIKIQEFTTRDLNYWGQFGISKECLKKYNVFSVRKLFINKRAVSTYTKEDPIYAYVFRKDNKLSYKIYKPFSKQYKWATNTDRSILQGWDQLEASGKELIITKSLKDVMVLNQMGYNCLSMQSEMSSIKDNVVDQLRKRFKTIYILQDFDHAGVCGSNKLRKTYGFIPFFIQTFSTRSNGLKDISDYVQEKGFEDGKLLINNILNKLNGR